MTDSDHQSPAEGLYWTNMLSSHLVDVVSIATRVHLPLPERPEVFAEKLRLFSTGAFVLKHRSAVVGYALSHPWLSGEIPPLDAFLGAIPPQADCLFLHDVAVLPRARGNRAAERLVEQLCAVAAARRLSRLALVPVYGTNRMWRRLGFRERRSPAIVEKLSTYGPTACYMIRDQ
jgi:GNAT superfamily N-acetyltransferase